MTELHLLHRHAEDELIGHSITDGSEIRALRCDVEVVYEWCAEMGSEPPLWWECRRCIRSEGNCPVYPDARGMLEHLLDHMTVHGDVVLPHALEHLAATVLTRG